MRKHVIFTAIAVAAVLFTACESVEIPAPDSGNAIEFRTLVDKNGTTKASLVEETKDLTSFFVTAWLEDKSEFMESAVWKKNFDWEYAPKKYYPVDGTKIDFFAYAPIKDVNMDNIAKLSYDGATVSFNYTVPFKQEVSNTAVDLLVACDIDKTDDGNAVKFDFNHALSGVVFSAKNNNPVNSELVYVISEIEILNLYNQGKFTYPLSWSNQSSLVNYKPGLPESGVSLLPTGSDGNYVNLLSANDFMMVLPQKTDATGSIIDGNNDGVPDALSTNPCVKVTFSLKDGSGAFVYKGYERYLPLPDDFTFKPGTLYNFQFQFNGPDAITFSVSLNKWISTEDENIPLK